MASFTLMEPARHHLTQRLIDSLYVEAMLLSDEARAYFDGQGRDERKALPARLQVGFSCEALKVTTRLMHVVAWLMTRRAHEAGELRRIATNPLAPGAESDEMLLGQLPETAQALIAASRDLYARIERLSGEGDGPQPSPARSLLGRLERSF